KVGERAPHFTLRDQLGRQVSLAGELEHGPVVLIFYRGEWCPYCNIMLRSYGLRAGDFSERGARLVAVLPQTPDNSLTMAQKHSLEFPVLSDEGGEVMARTASSTTWKGSRASCSPPRAAMWRSSTGTVAGSCRLQQCSPSTERESFAS